MSHPTMQTLTEILQKSLRNISKNYLWHIRLEQLTEEELDALLKKIKNRKAAGLDKIPSEVWKTRKFENILLWLYNPVYK